MKRFKVTMMVPQERIIEASDIQEAHNFVSKMMQGQPETNPGPKVHSIELLEEEVIDYDDFPDPGNVA